MIFHGFKYFYRNLSCAYKNIHLCWIPSHIAIYGKEAADMAAKESLSQDVTASQVPFTEFQSHINSFITNKWQECWSRPDNNRRRDILWNGPVHQSVHPSVRPLGCLSDHQSTIACECDILKTTCLIDFTFWYCLNTTKTSDGIDLGHSTKLLQQFED